MKKTIVCMLLCLTGLATMAQTSAESEKIYDHVEVNPSFPGGLDKMLPFMIKELKYPKECETEKVSGRVIVRFVVEQDGSITSPEVLRGIHPACNAEAIRVVKMMPKWEPGKIKGKAVRCHFCMPFMFRNK